MKKIFITMLSGIFIALPAWADSGHGDGHQHQMSIGEPGDASKVMRTVEVDMLDSMRFKPEKIQVKKGETIRFQIKNLGKVKHEFVLGTEAELKEHYAMMMKMPDMKHQDPNTVSIEAGQSGDVIWHFTQTGSVNFACLQPGHYDAGMKGVVTVR